MRWPYSEEAEKSVIGAFLCDSKIGDVIFEKLDSSDFYNPLHQKIFQSAQILNKNNKIIDMASLVDKNKGETAFLMGLGAEVGSTANIDHHCEIVKEKSLKRKMGKIAMDITKAVHEDVFPFDDLISQAETNLFGLSKEVYEQGLESVNKIKVSAQKELEKKRKGDIVGVNSGIKSIDNHFGGFQQGDLVCIAARPSMGKTALALNLADYIAENLGHVAFFSLEMTKEQLFNRCVSARSGISTKKIMKADLTPSEFDKYMTTCDYVSPRLYVDDTGNKKLSQIQSQCRRMGATKGLKAVFIDYLQLMDLELKNNFNVTNAVGFISKGLKTLAKELGCPIFVLSQLNRALAQRQDKKPQLSDLRDSGNIEQDIDIAMFIHREHVLDNTKSPFDAELLVRKFRNGETGSIPLTFIGKQMRFIEYDEKYNFQK